MDARDPREPLPAPGPGHPRVLAAFGLLKLAIQLAFLGGYGYFRDELYYLASTEHLDWGYVDHPPLSIAVLAVVRFCLGDSLPALRVVPALAGAATVVLTGDLARRLGGGAFAQALACLAAIAAPVFLAAHHVYSMNAFDLLFWTLAAWLLVLLLREPTTTRWAWLGVVLGLGLLNKLSVLWLGFGLGVGLLLTPHRRVLQTGGPYLAAAIAGTMFVPHLLWQVANGWPTLEFIRNATLEKMAPVSVADFALGQLRAIGPANAPVWGVGLVYALVARAARPWRVLAGIFLAVALLLAAGGRSRASYLAVAYPMLFALGGVAWERARLAGSTLVPRAAVAALVVAGGIVVAPLALPVLPVERFIAYQRALGLSPTTAERKEVGPLPQHFADMHGWQELVDLVEVAWRRLTPRERARCRVFGQNYGEAAAVDVLGRRRGLPPAMSGHNSYWLWGAGAVEPEVLIIIGGDREGNARFFDRIEIVGQTGSPYAMPYERGLDVSIAREPRTKLGEAWPMLRHFD